MAPGRWLGPTLAGLLLISAPAFGEDRRQDNRGSYVLSKAEHWSIANGSVEDLRAARRRWHGDFLWASRRGQELLIRDARLLDEAVALFDSLRETEPEQRNLELAQRDLEARRNVVEREQEEIEGELDRLADDDSQDAPPAEQARRGLEDRRRRLEERSRALDAEERDLDARERSIDERNDALEKEAEAALWRLIDRAASEGRAEIVRRR
jgi:chromosome segregation ATPase